MTAIDPTLIKSQAYVDGAWVDAQDGRRFDVLDPASGEVLGSVPDMGAAETRAAIAAAQAAWKGWRSRTAKDRAAVLKAWFDQIMANKDSLARLLSAEQGKSLAESTGEIAYGASFIEWFAEEGKRAYGDIIPTTASDRRLLVMKQSIGVVAAVTPWNFPNAMITRKCAPALAAGCPVVVKPAEDTPLSALALAELAERAGLPKGLFNVVTTRQPGAVGGEMTANPLVRKLSFTGSTRVGKLLMAQCAETVKKVSLELGGNAPFIVFDDCDLDAAVAGALASKFRNSGQTCVCTNRFLVQDGIYDAFATRLADKAAGLVVGHALKGVVQQGPLINAAAVAKVAAHVADAKAKGARVLTGGRPHALGGNFFEPTVLADVTPAMACFREETFGPLAPLIRFHSEDEAVALANDSEFGLAGYFYSRDIARVFRVAEALECGMVGVNEALISNEVAPFGGIKESGLGREGSKYGLDDFMEVKYVCVGGLS
ncbi:succinate-semialdehyde dehydrogenase (NADP(+)) [Paramagnetospirillum marisnigri]|uniref:Succinate-semialdehyde dehydrogenase (NADP(+)) n=1 Tax=Paramagnetospirillum marisnigri TaxID=1285242 RepID=A0A178MEZ4_9PROT|nr:NAD-dependent succinate-semialdehyde dehydrogenase [Paramagnetospirillum marisnigri]OAN46717.1 succinate-semialdehyde dehydrogenase (NADP(+)) [Paramagnetospirillum marisnigri]